MAETELAFPSPPCGAPRPAHPGRRRLTLSIALAAATLAALHPVLEAPFAGIDDLDYVVENPNVRGGLDAAGAAWAFTHFHVANWHPLTWLSHMLDVTLFGLAPAGHHGVNLLFHALNALLLFSFLSTATGRDWEGAAAAALFALHPMHVEPVAWIAQRKELLCTGFSLLSLMGYARYVRAPSAARYAATLLPFAAALLSKQMAVTLPFLMLVLDRWPLGRAGVPLRRRLLEKVPLLAMSAAACVLTVLAQVAGKGLTLTLAEFTLRQRVESSLLATAAYIRKAAWPDGLAVYYPFPSETFPAWEVAAAAALLSGASWLAWRFRESGPWLLAGWLWFLGTLVPVIGLVRVGRQFIADRYSYFPYIGLFIIASWAVSGAARRLGARPARPALLAAAMLPVAAFGAAAYGQATVWRSNESLFRQALSSTRANAFVEFLMGRELALQGRLDEAIVHLENALRLAPDAPEAYNDLGIGLSLAGRFDEAEMYYREGIRRAPDAPNGYTNLAADYLGRGMWEQAIPLLEECLRRNPGHPAAGGLLVEAVAARDRAKEN